jgi:chemotaxis protein MotB
MADERPIIIKRIKKAAAGHHGGSWKVAYADFVTAMMAFFLLLWLLNAVTEEQKRGIADYFRPTLAPQENQGQTIILDGQPAIMQATQGATGAESDVDADSEGANTTDGAAKDAQPAQNTDKAVSEQQAREVVAKAEQKQFEQVKLQIQEAIKQSPELRDLQNNLLIDQTPEGLRIQLIDRDKVSMFNSGSAVLNQRSRDLLQKVSQTIRGMPNKLSISGHTDAAPYAGQNGYTNWELSSDRANASRRALVEDGIDPNRVQAVNGKAATEPLDPKDPLSPSNRRISIVLLHTVPPVSQTQGQLENDQKQREAAQRAAAVGDPAARASVPKIIPPATLQKE